MLARHGATPDALRAAARPMDPEALAALGIDLDEIRRRAEASFGPGALERGAAAPRRAHPRSPPRPRRRSSSRCARPLRLGDREIGAEHVLLGLLRGGEVTPLLERVGAAVDAIRAEVSPAGSRRGRGG